MPSKGVGRINGIKYIHVSMAIVSFLVSLPTFFSACNKKVCFTTGENNLGVETGNDARWQYMFAHDFTNIAGVQQTGGSQKTSESSPVATICKGTHAWASQ